MHEPRVPRDEDAAVPCGTWPQVQLHRAAREAGVAAALHSAAGGGAAAEALEGAVRMGARDNDERPPGNELGTVPSVAEIGTHGSTWSGHKTWDARHVCNLWAAAHGVAAMGWPQPIMWPR